jgi:prepilin-type N-terminal cleavage/methylation domain-containing protein
MRPLLRNKNKSSYALFESQGFTLIEILVALVLVTLVLTLVISNPFSSRDDLDKDVGDVERALRFMGDEAILRNSVLRIHFFLDKEPQEYGVEYGPSDNFILPSEPQHKSSVLSKSEEEKNTKMLKDINLKFNRVSEYAEKNAELGNNIKVLGVATLQSEKIQTTGEASLYAFPSGERDAALVIIGNEEEVVSIRTNTFTAKIERKRHKLEARNTKELSEQQKNLAVEIFEEWKNAK